MENIESTIDPNLSMNREYYNAETSNIQVEVVPFFVPERSDPANNQFFMLIPFGLPITVIVHAKSFIVIGKLKMEMEKYLKFKEVVLLANNQ